MSASDAINPEQHEQRPKRTKTWSSVRREDRPSIRDAELKALYKKKQEEKTKGYSDRSKLAVQKRKASTEWSEKKQTLDRNLIRPYDRTINPVGFIAPAMFTDEDFKNEGPSEGKKKPAAKKPAVSKKKQGS